MAYITEYLRKNRSRRVESVEPTSQVESATSESTEPVFLLDYETWYACLSGWSPIPMHTIGGMMLLKATEEKKAA
jgi:hypothetical protein